MALSDKKILTSERNAVYVKSNAGKRLTGTTEQNKDAFDKFPQLIMDKYNELIDLLTALGLDSIDTDLSSRYTKAETDAAIATETNDLVETITYTAGDGKFTITTKDGTSTTIDTNIEKIPASFELIEEDGKTYLKITNDDGSTSKTDVSSLVNIYSFSDSDTIDFTENSGQVTAVVKNNSITLDHLSLAVVSTIEGYVSAAASSASSASASASAAEQSAGNASTFEQSAMLYAEDAKGYKDEAATNASNSASNAATAAQGASQAAASVNQAASQAQAAANSATLSKSYAQGGTGTRAGEDTNNAKYYMEQAAGIVSEAGLGDMLRATYDPQGKAQDIFKYADTKVSKVSSPTAGNIPILTADGQIADSGKNADEVGSSDLPEVTTSDAGKALVVGSDGNWMASEIEIPEITVDSELSSTSTNPVQNKVIKAALDNIPSLPSATSSDTGKTLMVDSNGNWTASFPIEWFVSVPVSGWSSSTTNGWYTNQITVSGMKAVYNPIATLAITSAEIVDDEQAAFAAIKEIETFDGYIICRSVSGTDIDINLKLTGV